MTSVAFLHPDLGIGGAERAVVDAGLALKTKGYRVKYFTAHHSLDHCFTETADGQLEVVSAGDWLPRSICGRFMAAFAYLRMIYVTVYFVLFHSGEYQVAYVDQISAGIPLLKWLTPLKVE